MVEVFHLEDKERKFRYSLPPREAVIAAFAQQERNDFNSWDYAERYGDEVQEANGFVACGKWAAQLEEDDDD